ncbi:deoxyribose-phosphate aldolase [Cellulophaga baltica]|uniref:DUF6503 family protein n=1 Tax=Cellulophaga TaxID=104264 RepID=UPI001C065F86|nr:MULTISPECIES: DUF6503 family protein [Cellulophaga]MBU2996052.1 deoxyribose-phosphate aldolase [Cellulophaga baltica]MDO6767447.1 deoxyribose-phosphate aldolase [Cellulophaga sp. 1_MG-2023]
MRKLGFIIVVLLFVSCKQEAKKSLSAQNIVDKAIVVAGGDLYKTSTIAFKFRDSDYVSENNGAIMKRAFESDSISYVDIKKGSSFERIVNGIPVAVSDSLANVHNNAINSVLYFVQLPYQLNAKAVHKKLLKEEKIKGKVYYLIHVTFDQNGGGDDFEDNYYYWINKKTFKPDYFAYDYKVNGGGVRFREAYKERIVNGIRFVDYNNYKPKSKATTINEVAALYENGELELLSKIVLENIKVTPSN